MTLKLDDGRTQRADPALQPDAKGGAVGVLRVLGDLSAE